MTAPAREDGRWARRIARAVAIAGVLLLVLAVRVVTASRAELVEADRLRERGDVDASVAHYRRAARWYAPGNPYSTDALDRLAEIAQSAEAARDPDLALAAWRSVRGAILGARSFYVPHQERLERADEHIATLMAAMRPPPVDAGRSEAERRAAHLELLREVPRPSPFWGLVALLGLATWIVAALAFVTRAIDEEDRLVAAQARVWGTVWILGFGSFLLGLALA
ncbi:hypothetical protein [Sandaracinus amylolyticus]|uniref:hypothetical protein n=1 Tax=Sandaracinus amylolyticus TaxID=927083 RepID=UPI001F198DC0|nr:hypothetical protein [Sandaracinus amylolyticus]UJR81815.1 Hypothetical protein I5071_38750 [Sandaracinus amylolyticus]